MCLAILRAPLDRLDIKGLSHFLSACQANDGSYVFLLYHDRDTDYRFSPVPPEWMEDGGFQNDVRMTYCASVVMSVVGRYEVELERAVDFVKRCQVSYI
jgi:geranylgeranyl transferase type-1 subunit beta